MNIKEIKQELKSENYDFLRTNEHLGNNVILLGLGGSYAYGTNIETSDLDVRGCALNKKHEILLNKDFEQVVDNNTDTTIYSFNKLVELLTNCNPNTIEMLGLKPEHYLYLSPIGKELINHKNLFLSKQAAYSFGGYATQQLRRLDNKSSRVLDQPRKEKHIFNSMNNLMQVFPTRYADFAADDFIKLYVDESQNPELLEEIFMDVNLTHYPLRDYKGMLSELTNIIREYNKIGVRNKKAIQKNKLSKHMMHLVRLYLMCFDILENEEIVTYCEKEHDFLMSIRDGVFLDNNHQPTPEFLEMVDEYEKRLDYDKKNTNLPDKPNQKEIDNFVMSINEKIIKGEL